ncbi:vWA-like protein [Exidia glandulosa HHB12029]|uniref:VWA-like protein n=1 Tax=Exidia glandulosa HHB12029 TaxID=1314781 RepID=A0A165DCE8_EXIGL|nr:vWA-like protein [Exidia glandulosa HHB12029]
MDRDVVIAVKASGLDSPRCVLERLQHEQETSNCFALTLVHRFALKPLDIQDYIFLVDRSGSMEGQRIAKVRDALQIMLRSLPFRGTSFNIVSFGSRFDALWSGPREYTAKSVDEASALVDGMKADYSGTEIQKVLEFAFAMRAQDKPTVVIVLTDGEARDVSGVVTSLSTVVSAAEGFLRVFTLGVGEQVSKEMCDGIARAGRGVASYVGSDENPDAKLVTLLRATRTLAVQDVSVDWRVTMDPERNDDCVVVDAHLEDETPAAPIALFGVASPRRGRRCRSGWGRTSA